MSNVVGRAVNKLNHLFFKTVGKHIGMGSPVSKSTWEQQYSSDVWDYLENPDEAEHYECIVEFYQKYATSNASILDIGSGKGVLYSYFKKWQPVSFFGIDISENAVKAAAKQFPEAKWETINYDNEYIGGKYDVVIFNETLYYFTRPVKTIKKCLDENMKSNGLFIISMCEYEGHDKIWKDLEKVLTVKEERTITNSKGQTWVTKALVLKLL